MRAVRGFERVVYEDCCVVCEFFCEVRVVFFFFFLEVCVFE